MARPRKPTALKLLDGDFQVHPERRNHNEPTPATKSPTCPAHLDATAKAEWKRICKELNNLGVLSESERGALEQYCKTYSEWRHAIKVIDSEGRYYQTDKGPAEHPASKALRALSVVCHKYLSEFGLTPASRTRLHVTQPTEQDETFKRYFG